MWRCNACTSYWEPNIFIAQFLLFPCPRLSFTNFAVATMNQVLRIDNNDPRIIYEGEWIQNVNYSFTSSGRNPFFLLFRGTSIKVYGDSSGGGGLLQLSLDGKDTDVVLNNINFAKESSLIFRADDMVDGDHQLVGSIPMIVGGARIAVDYFEIENRSGRGFDLLSAGPNATDVPQQAVVVDDNNPDIIFHNRSEWVLSLEPMAFERTLFSSSVAGASLSYSFDGVALWYYGRLGPNVGFFTVSIDGSRPQRFLNGRNSVELDQRMLWSNTSLGPGRHTITLTQDDVTDQALFLDFFRILGEEDATSPLSTTTTTGLTTESQPVTSIPTSKTNLIPLAVGLTLGLLAIMIVVLSGGCYLYHQRRKKGLHLATSPAPPYVVPPMTQRSGPSQDRKRPPQPTRLSGVPVTMSHPGLPEFGRPPSYQSREDNGGVAS